jgi:hypothetical protein
VVVPTDVARAGYCHREDAAVGEAKHRVQLVDAQVLQAARRAARSGKDSGTGGVASKYNHEQ